jgi:hypothetical protein
MNKKHNVDDVRLYYDQFERLAKARSAASWKIVLRLLLLTQHSSGGVIQLDNDALKQIGVNRWAKYRALRELEELGLVEVRRSERKSPGIVIQEGIG